MSEADDIEAMVQPISEAIYDFRDSRFPEGALPGGVQLFADDHLDAEFKHEAGCDELARVVAQAAYSIVRGRMGVMERLLWAAMDDASVQPIAWYAEARALLGEPVATERNVAAE